MSVTRPSAANRNCVTACTRTLMMMLAAESGPGTAQNVRSRAPTMSPPTCVSGSRELTASRMNLRRTATRRRTRSAAGSNHHHPAPATATVATRVSTTSANPQPTLAMASATACTPDHKARPMQTAIPTHHATIPTCLRLPIRTLALDESVGYRVKQGLARQSPNCRGKPSGSVGRPRERFSGASSPRAQGACRKFVLKTAVQS